jgi:hypothetical protein
MAAVNYAYHPPGGAAYQPADADPSLEQQPPNMGSETHDVVSDPSRLGGAKALGLKERGT